MKYFKAKQYIDDSNLYGGVIVKDELFTDYEMSLQGRMKYINNFNIVDINEKNTYYFFGARFELEVKNNEI
jgi:hypothetical protein